MLTRFIRQPFVAVIFFALSIIVGTRCEAAPFKAKDIKVTDTNIKSIEVEYTSNGLTLSRIISCYGKMTGLSFKKKGFLYFRSLKDELKSISSNIKTNASNKKKVALFRTQQDQLKALILASANTCSSLTAPGTPAANPTPSLTPIPTVMPTVPSSNLNFDSVGNVTDQGKTLFKIPYNLQANTIRGQQAFVRYTCTGCHIEPGGYDYVRIGAALSKSPMKEFGVSTQEMADLVAWLNRGRM